MATSNSDDPVQTIVDLLDGTDEADWPSETKPTPIETHWASDFQTKSNRSGVAVYVRSPEDSSHEQLSAAGDHKHQTETVATEIWSPDESEHTDAVADVRAILEDYWTDTDGDTKWDRIRPQANDDRRQEHPARRTGMYVTSITISLQRDGSIGT